MSNGQQERKDSCPWGEEIVSMRERRKAQDRVLDEIASDVKDLAADLKEMRTTLLNGGKGLIQEHTLRLQSLEEWRRAHGPTQPQPGEVPRSKMRAYVQAVPWWGWPVVIYALSRLGPEAWQAIIEVAKAIAR